MPIQTDNNSVDRRSFLAASAAGAVAVANAPSAIAKVTGPSLHAGADLGKGWTIAQIETVEAGAIRIVAGHGSSERIANISICRTESGSGALASTGAVDLFLMNDGADGKRLTPADEVSLVKRLASRLHGSEESLPGAARLLGRQERQAAFDPIDHLDPIDR